MTILIELLIIGCVCNGISIATLEGMILYKPYIWLEKRLPIFIFKPLIGCVNCMASVWGTTIHFLLAGTFITWPLIVLSAIFVNGLLAEFYNKLQR